MFIYSLIKLSALFFAFSVLHGGVCDKICANLVPYIVH